MESIRTGYSYYEFVGDGVTDVFPVNFVLGALQPGFVTCQVDNEVDGLGNPVYRELVFTPGESGTVKVLGPAAAAGAPVVFRRVVPKDVLLHMYANGSILDYPSLDETHLQLMMAVQELLDGFGLANIYTDINMHGFNIIGVKADSTNPTSVVTFEKLREFSADVQALVTLGTPDGADLVGYGSGSVKDRLDAIEGSGGSALVGFLQSGTGATSRTAQAKLRDFVSVKDFGAVGDGVTDDTAAFRAVITYAASVAVAGGVVSSNNSGRVRIHIPAGRYLVSDGIIQDGDFSGRTGGLTIEGCGQYATEIVYSPSGSAPLVYNGDDLLFVRFKGMTFYANSATTDFLYSYSEGGAQDYLFSDCSWVGTWRYGVHLKGTNSNSEMAFEKCLFAGAWTVFLYSEDSDQFLNYWFNECKYWCSSSWMKFTKGGNIKIANCDVSGYKPSAETYLFRLEGIVHARGVCSFVCHATRFELKNTNAKIIYSEWPQGNIMFSGCDTESQTPFVAAFNTAYFKFVNVPGPSILWLNCSLMGTHTYAADGGSNQFQYMPRISYINCNSTHFEEPNDFILRTHTINSGGRPPVRLVNCRGIGTASPRESFDSDQGWHEASRAITGRKIVAIRGASTSSPISGGTESIRLPLNSVITKVWLHNRAGSTSNYGPYDFTIETGESPPTVLGTASGSTLAYGFSVTADLFFICNSDEKRTISVVDNESITNTGDNYFLIEYIG